MIPLIPDPWRLASRVLAVGLLLFAVYLFGRHDGAAHVQAQWQADKAAQAGRQAQAEKLMRERENLMNERLRKAESNAETRQKENRTQQKIRCFECVESNHSGTDKRVEFSFPEAFFCD